MTKELNVGRPENPFEIELVTEIKNVRKTARISKEEAAQICGLPKGTFCWIESTRRVSPEQKKLLKVGLRKMFAIAKMKAA